MKRLLDNYIFSDQLRYEGHRLVYAPESGEPIVMGGILGAALLCVRLLNTDEQKERGFLLSEALRYEQFFEQYESEVIADDWGYIEAELEQLDLAYLDLCSNEDVSEHSPIEYSDGCSFYLHAPYSYREVQSAYI